jgi:hypothetical protein
LQEGEGHMYIYIYIDTYKLINLVYKLNERGKEG